MSFVGWLHVVFDFTSFVSFVAIPVVLVQLLRQQSSSGVPPLGKWIITFSLACGLSHLIDALSYWVDKLPLVAVAKGVTALVCAGTVLALARALPRIRRSPSLAALTEQLEEADRERRDAEARSRQLSQVVDRSSDAIIGLDGDGLVISWNLAAARIFGMTPYEAVGTDVLSLVQAEQRDELVRFLERAYTDPDASMIDSTLTIDVIRKTGPARQLELTLALTGKNPESLVALGLVGRDVTDRNHARRQVEEANARLAEANRTLEYRVEQRTRQLKRLNEELSVEIAERREMEESLRTSQRMLEDAQTMSGVASFLLDTDGRVSVASSNLQLVLGLPQGISPSVFTPHLTERYLPEEVVRIRSAVRACLDEGKPYEIEVELVPSDGPSHILVRGRPKRDAEGAIIGVEGSIIDISESRAHALALARAKEQLEQAVAEATAELRRTVEDLESANRELESFVHMASHDMQEPLRALVSCAGLLEEDLGSTLVEPARTDLRHIREAAERMRRMLSALVELSHTGRSAVARTKVDIEEIVQGILGDFAHVIEEKAAEISIPELPEVVADMPLIERIYSNLVSNALKFGGSPPQVALTFEDHAEDWVLGVEDGGQGIQPEDRERAFQPFRRLARDRSKPGSGMGLAICRRAAERMGGEIWLEDAALGGAHVRFSIPKRA